MKFLINFWRVTPFRLRHDIHPFPFCCLASLDVRPGKIVYESINNNPFLDTQAWRRRPYVGAGRTWRKTLNKVNRG